MTDPKLQMQKFENGLIANAPMSRRVLAKLAAAGTLWMAAPFRHALAQQGTDLKRVAIVVSCNGWSQPTWISEKGGKPVYGDSAKALEPFADKTIVLSGLNNKMGTDKNHHQLGLKTMLTGLPLTKQFKAAGPSFDQVVKDKVGGGNSPFPTITLGYLTEKESNSRTRVFFSGLDSPIHPEANPRSAFNKLFGNGSPEGNSNTDAAALEARRKRVMDIVRGHVAMLERELVGDDLERLQNHLSSIDTIDKQINAPVAIGCGGPEIPAEYDKFEEGRLQGRILGAALSCGITNVANLQIAAGGYRLPYSFIPGNKEFAGSHHWHTVSHSRPRPQGNEASRKWYGAIDETHALPLVEMLKQLDSIPEGDGTMLDHTAVLYVTDLSVPYAHSHKNLQWHLFGGGAAKRWRGNRFLKTNGVEAQKIWVDVQRALGIDSDQFGKVNGGIPGLSDLA